MMRLKMRAVHLAKTAVQSAVIAMATVVAGCSGDATPFEESVEVSLQQLSVLSVLPPKNRVAISIDAEQTTTHNLTINVGEQLQFTILAENTSGAEVSLSALDRSWAVSNPEFARVSKDGLLSAVAEGETHVFVTIGGISSTQFKVKISNATLNAVAGIYGDNSVERCLAKTYYALGEFSDGSTRVLEDLDWSTSDNEVSYTKNEVTNKVQFVAVEPGSIDLIASVEGALAFSKTLTVNESLLEVTLSPDEPEVEVDESISMQALGVYSINELEQSHTITSDIVWSLPENNGAASVSNVRGSAGVVTGISEGSTVLTARCGKNGFVTQVPVTVVANLSQQGLVFKQTAPVNLTLSNTATFDLEASTGSSYDSDYKVTSAKGATWSVTSGTNVLSVDEEGTLTLLAVGDAIVQVNYQSFSATISISVK